MPAAKSSAKTECEIKQVCLTRKHTHDLQTTAMGILYKKELQTLCKVDAVTLTVESIIYKIDDTINNTFDDTINSNRFVYLHNQLLTKHNMFHNFTIQTLCTVVVQVS